MGMQQQPINTCEGSRMWTKKGMSLKHYWTAASEFLKSILRLEDGDWSVWSVPSKIRRCHIINNNKNPFGLWWVWGFQICSQNLNDLQSQRGLVISRKKLRHQKLTNKNEIEIGQQQMAEFKRSPIWQSQNGIQRFESLNFEPGVMFWQQFPCF